MTRTLAALPETNLKVMEHLHTYRFLTPPQLLRLGVASHIVSLRRVLRRFETSRKYVDFAEFGVVPKIGRLPRVYYLTERGGEIPRRSVAHRSEGDQLSQRREVVCP